MGGVGQLRRGSYGVACRQHAADEDIDHWAGQYSHHPSCYMVVLAMGRAPAVTNFVAQCKYTGTVTTEAGVLLETP